MAKYKIVVSHHDFDTDSIIEGEVSGSSIIAIGKSGQKRLLSPNWVKPVVDMSYEETYDKKLKALKDKFDVDLKALMKERDDARTIANNALSESEKEQRLADKAEEKRLADKEVADKETARLAEIQKEKDAALLKEKIRVHASNVADVIEGLENEIKIAEEEIELCGEKILLHESTISDEKENEKDSVVLEKKLSELNTSILEEKNKVVGFKSLIDRKQKEIAGAASFTPGK